MCQHQESKGPQIFGYTRIPKFLIKLWMFDNFISDFNEQLFWQLMYEGLVLEIIHCSLSCFGRTYTKIGTIQRRLAWPLRKDDTQNREAFHIFCTRMEPLSLIGYYSVFGKLLFLSKIVIFGFYTMCVRIKLGDNTVAWSGAGSNPC